MPMRPAMSVMEETDILPVSAQDAGLDGRLRRCPPTLVPGGRPRSRSTVRDADTGQLVADLVRTHQVWMHLIVTRADLGTFAHLHPEPTGTPGVFAVDATFPTAGPVRRAHRAPRAGPDGRRPGRPGAHRRRPARRPRSRCRATTSAPVRQRRAGQRSTVDAGARRDQRLHAPGRARRRQRTDRTGRRPAALPRCRRARRGDARRRRRPSPTGTPRPTTTAGRPVLALPGTTFGPDLDLHVRFDRPGAYRLWAQFAPRQRHGGHAPFVVHVPGA